MTWTRRSSRAYGRAVSIYTADDLDVSDHLPCWWRDEEVEGEQHVAIEAGDDVPGLIHELEFWVAEHATEAVFLHAGVVALGDRALLLPGRSHAGKSSLVAALLRAGASYGSDEFAVIAPDGVVHAYPRRLVLRTPEGVHRVDPADLGGDSIMMPARLSAVVDMTYAPGAAWSVEPLARSRALMHMLDNAVAARTRPAAALDSLTAALAGLEVALRGVRGDADDAAARLIRLLG